MRDTPIGIISEDERVTHALTAVIGTGFALLISLIWFGHTAEVDRVLAAQEFSDSLATSGETSTRVQRISLLLYGVLNQKTGNLRPAVSGELNRELAAFSKTLESLRLQRSSELLSLDIRSNLSHIVAAGEEFASLTKAIERNSDKIPKEELARFAKVGASLDSELEKHRQEIVLASIRYAAIRDSVRNKLFYFTLVLATSIGALILGFVATRVRSELTLRRRTEAKLLKANAELEHFSSIVAHDLNGPLANISLASQLLAKENGRGSSISSEITEGIQKETRRLHDMVAGLLQLSRIGRIPLQKQPLDVQSLLAAVQSKLQIKIEATGVRIARCGSNKLWGDSVLLEQLLHNLIDNSLKYARQGETPEISIDTRTDNGFAILKYEDNGKGISPEVGQQVFQPFYQCPGDESSGVGLGLSVVKKIVALHEGEIEIVPKETPGVLFVIRIPHRLPSSLLGQRPQPTNSASSLSAAMRRAAAVSRFFV